MRPGNRRIDSQRPEISLLPPGSRMQQISSPVSAVRRRRQAAGKAASQTAAAERSLPAATFAMHCAAIFSRSASSAGAATPSATSRC